jgi:hypothetical protein
MTQKAVLQLGTYKYQQIYNGKFNMEIETRITAITIFPDTVHTNNTNSHLEINELKKINKKRELKL